MQMHAHVQPTELLEAAVPPFYAHLPRLPRCSTEKRGVGSPSSWLRHLLLEPGVRKAETKVNFASGPKAACCLRHLATRPR